MTTPGNKEVYLFLIGKTGNGKSRTGNAILGRDAFVSSDSSVSVTFAVSSQWRQFGDRIIKVVDGPGLCDTALDPGAAAKKLTDDMYKGMAQCPNGFNALVLVLKYGSRYTDEERQTLANLKTLFGENFVKDFCVLIFTHGDSFRMNHKKNKKQFSDWCKEQKDSLKELFEECQYRAVLFSNCEEEQYESQLKDLLALVDGLQSNGARYTKELFQKCSSDRERMALENDFHLKENIQKRINLLFNSYDNFDNAYQSDDELKRKVVALRDDALAFDVEIAVADKGTGVLNNLRERVTHIIKLLEDKKSTLAKKNAQCAEIRRLEQEHKRKMDQLNTSSMNKSNEMKVSMGRLKQEHERKMEQLNEQLDEKISDLNKYELFKRKAARFGIRDPNRIWSIWNHNHPMDGVLFYNHLMDGVLFRIINNE